MRRSVEMVPVRDAESFIDALNHAAEVDGGPVAQIESLLKSLRRLLGREDRSAFWLLDDLDRRPLPRIVSRYVSRPESDPIPPKSLPELQEMIDGAAPFFTSMLAQIRANMRTPFTAIASDSAEAEWFESVLVDRYLRPMGYADAIVSLWAESETRAVMLAHLRRAEDAPFTDRDMTTISLMLRAAAPFIDRQIFRKPDILDQQKLSPRQQEVLLLLLSGPSEKEIAIRLHRSVHTVHTFVRQIYDSFDVQSRGELMAIFIDKKVIERGTALAAR